MKITELLSKKRSISFEVFPPKSEMPIEPLMNTLGELYKLSPDFISCTYGAGGTNVGRSVEVCTAVKDSGHTIVPHFTCIGNSRDDVKLHAERYIRLGVENILLLRGDLPDGWTGTRGDFAYASDLISHFRGEYPWLAIGAAAYPEVHVDSRDIAEDTAYTKLKQDSGADFFMTQLCYDTRNFYRFIERIRAAGVTKPVIAGILPVMNKDGVVRMALENGCSLPSSLSAIVGRYYDDPESFLDAGLEYTAGLVWKFFEYGAAGVHFYTLNKHESVSRIFKLCPLLRRGGQSL